MSGKTKITGTADHMQIVGSIDVQNPGYDKIDAENLSGSFLYKNNKISFKPLKIITKSGLYTGEGYIPINLDLFSSDSTEIKKIPINFLFNGSTDNIEYIPKYFSLIDSITGPIKDTDTLKTYSMQLDITGTIEKPIRNGFININKGSIYFNPIDEKIEGINGYIKINNNHLIVDELKGKISNKDYLQFAIPFMKHFKKIFNDPNKKEEYNIEITGSMDINSFFNPKFAIHIKGDGIHLTSSYNLFRGTGGADIYVTGQDTVFITGQFQPNPHDFTITRLTRDKLYGAPLYNNNKMYIYDIHFPFEEGIQVQTENMNILVEGDITISKYSIEEYNFSGKLDIIDGRFYDNQGNIYEDITGNLFLSPDENASYMDIHSITRIDTSYINVMVMGNPYKPQIYLSSPEMQYNNQTELLSMLAYGNQGILDDNEQIQIEKQVGNYFTNYLENVIAKNISQNTPFDEFQLSSRGSILNTFEGGEDIDIKLILGKRLSNRMYLNSQIDFRDFNENQYEAEYRISKNASVVGGINTNDINNSFHIKYRIKYYY